MTDIDTAVPNGATLKLSEQTINALLDAWRNAGGVAYSSPKGQVCAMAQPKLMHFLSEFLLSADRTLVDRGAPAATDLSQRLATTEQALQWLVQAVCPGLAHDNLLDAAEYALAAMASAEPVAHFQCETGDDNVVRYNNVQDEFKTDPDIFPLYRRAPTVAELAAHVDQHQVASEVNVADAGAAQAQAATKAAPTAKKAASK